MTIYFFYVIANAEGM